MNTDTTTTPSRQSVAKRLLTIESYICSYYQCDTREVGKLTKKFIRSEELGLVIVAYNQIFGRHTTPMPYHVLAIALERNRTTALNWEKKAYGYLDVYKNKREKFDRFLSENTEDILNDCKTNEGLQGGMYVRVVDVFNTEKIEPKKLAAPSTEH